MTKKLYTIGYSSYTPDTLIDVLKKHQIDVLADVRSVPYSRYKPEFNREILQNVLEKQNIRYLFLGDQCGARIDAPECFTDGRADYRKIANHPLFTEGVARIKQGMQKYTVAIMCAEKDPVACHRTILVCRNLRSADTNICHILADGETETQASLEKRLMARFHLDQPDLFSTEAERLEKAYDLQGEKIAYAEDKTDKQEEVENVFG